MPDAVIFAYSADGRSALIVDGSTERGDARPEVWVTVLEVDSDPVWARSIAHAPDPIPAAEVDSIWAERTASI